MDSRKSCAAGGNLQTLRREICTNFTGQMPVFSDGKPRRGASWAKRALIPQPSRLPQENDKKKVYQAQVSASQLECRLSCHLGLVSLSSSSGVRRAGGWARTNTMGHTSRPKTSSGREQGGGQRHARRACACTHEQRPRALQTTAS